MSKLRDQILEYDDINSDLVEVPQWGNIKIELRTITARERTRMLRAFTDSETGELDVEQMYPTLLIATCHDPETGEKLFEPSDADAILSKSSAPVEMLAMKAMALAGMREVDVDEAGNASTGTPSGD